MSKELTKSIEARIEGSESSEKKTNPVKKAINAVTESPAAAAIGMVIGGLVTGIGTIVAAKLHKGRNDDSDDEEELPKESEDE